jgi:predicted RNase H-like HicB family nuclease
MKKHQLPIFIEKDEDGFYVAECPVFSGCYTQGKTMDEAMKNIREVIDLCLEEKPTKSIF